MSGLAFRSYLRAARRRLKLTQKALGSLCSPAIPEGRISDIERGIRKPTRDEADRLFLALSETYGTGKNGE